MVKGRLLLLCYFSVNIQKKLSVRLFYSELLFFFLHVISPRTQIQPEMTSCCSSLVPHMMRLTLLKTNTAKSLFSPVKRNYCKIITLIIGFVLCVGIRYLGFYPLMFSSVCFIYCTQNVCVLNQRSLVLTGVFAMEPHQINSSMTEVRL